MLFSTLASSVETLLTNFEIVDIILIVFLVALAIKEVWSLIKWFKNEGKDRLNKEKEQEEQENKIKTINNKQENIEKDLGNIHRLVEMLITANKNDIKAWITDKYHILMDKEWVDDYELDCLERRYSDYLQMGGNSYIEDLMNDIRKLPKHPPKNDENRYFEEE